MKKKRYVVESGDLMITVYAKDCDKAFKKAIKNHVGTLGVIVSFAEEGCSEEETVYCDTLTMLKKAGYKVQ